MTLAPLQNTAPPDAGTSPEASRSNVVLPQPDGPTTVVIFPGGHVEGDAVQRGHILVLSRKRQADIRKSDRRLGRIFDSCLSRAPAPRSVATVIPSIPYTVG